jgi:hypothetical protein
MQKADVLVPLVEGSHHVGLLCNEPPGRTGLLFIQSSEALKLTRRMREAYNFADPQILNAFYQLSRAIDSEISTTSPSVCE